MKLRVLLSTSIYGPKQSTISTHLQRIDGITFKGPSQFDIHAKVAAMLNAGGFGTRSFQGNAAVMRSS